ncbi:MAG TPA: DUF4279 domain-containing protein [Candidatus Sulfotelmatobacter sp.]|nr:DUF4279 domain-containing protein [Candidatus Sulfotelmatobacter sp.]
MVDRPAGAEPGLIRAYLAIVGVDPSEVSNMLGIKPATTLAAGRLLRSGITAPENRWEVRSEARASGGLSPVVRALLDNFSDWQVLRELSQRARIEVEIALYIGQEHIDATLDADIVLRLASIGAELLFFRY